VPNDSIDCGIITKPAVDAYFEYK
jgi:hypothetical protein